MTQISKLTSGLVNMMAKEINHKPHIRHCYFTDRRLSRFVFVHKLTVHESIYIHGDEVKQIACVHIPRPYPPPLVLFVQAFPYLFSFNRLRRRFVVINHGRSAPRRADDPPATDTLCFQKIFQRNSELYVSATRPVLDLHNTTPHNTKQ